MMSLTVHYISLLTGKDRQVQAHKCGLTDVNMLVRKYLQATVRRFLCAAVNIRFMMVRPNKTKPKGYMWPPTVPGGRRHSSPQGPNTPGSNPGRSTIFFIHTRRDMPF